MKSLSVFRSFGTARQRYSYLTITALLMAIGIFCYYFYFLSSKAQSLEERNYRILNRVEDKLASRLNTYTQMAKSRGEATAWRLYYEAQYGSAVNLDSLIALRSSATVIESFLTGQLDYIRDDYDEDNAGLNAAPPKVMVTKSWDHAGTLVNVRQDTTIDSLLIFHVETPVESNNLLFVVKSDFVIPFSAVLRPILRRDVFSNYMVLRDNRVVYETESSGMLRFEPDTVRKGETALLPSTAQSNAVIINGQECKVYSLGFALEGDHQWKLIAFKDTEGFFAEQRTIPRRYLFAVFVGILFLVLSVPFIKALIMSRTERLGTPDVIFSAVSLAITTSIVAILMVDGYMNSELDRDETTQQLVGLSSEVEAHLVKEISAVVTELQHFSKVELEATAIPEIKLFTEEREVYQPVAYPGYSDLFLVDSMGFSGHNLVRTGAFFDVNNRAYFSALMQGRCMNSPGVPAPFYLDAVVSWSEQEFRAVVSTPIPATVQRRYEAIAAMSVRLRSLTNVQLMPGTGFMVFDSKGDVFFHSDTTLSLNENLVEECGHDPLLMSAINGRTAWNGELDYAGEECRMYVRPLAGTPYFIATFAYLEPRDAMHGQVFGSAFLLQILLFVFYVVIIFSGLMLVRKTSRLKRPFISLSAFIPDTKGNTRYLDALLFNLCHGIVLVATAAVLRESLAVIILFFVAAPYTVLFNTIELSTNSFRGLIHSERRKIIWIYTLAIVAVNVFTFTFVEAWWLLVLAQVLMVVIYWLITERSELFVDCKVFRKIASFYSYANHTQV